jgi:hypothetical protein
MAVIGISGANSYASKSTETEMDFLDQRRSRFFKGKPM